MSKEQFISDDDAEKISTLTQAMGENNI